MANIYFTQYVRPDGRKELVSIDRPDYIAKAADKIISHGFRFEIEMLTTDDVSMTISDDNADYAIRVVPNGPGVPLSVDDIIKSFDLAAAIKQKVKNAKP